MQHPLSIIIHSDSCSDRRPSEITSSNWPGLLFRSTHPHTESELVRGAGVVNNRELPLARGSLAGPQGGTGGDSSSPFTPPPRPGLPCSPQSRNPRDPGPPSPGSEARLDQEAPFCEPSPPRLAHRPLHPKRLIPRGGKGLGTSSLQQPGALCEGEGCRARGDPNCITERLRTLNLPSRCRDSGCWHPPSS